MHNRFVLKSREIDHLDADLSSVSKKLRLATINFDAYNGDMHDKLNTLKQRAGKKKSDPIDFVPIY